jgi:CheY-like chemotaxis protein
MRILYVEDNLVNLALMERITQTKGYEVLSVTSAEEALEILNIEPVDLIIVDVRLAGEMNGIEFTRWLREHNETRPIIITTAYETLYDRDTALAAGCDEFLAKPISVRQILALLAHYGSS